MMREEALGIAFVPHVLEGRGLRHARILLEWIMSIDLSTLSSPILISMEIFL